MQRLEGLSKLSGAERYLDDEPLEGTLKGCLWGMTVRSPASRGKIRQISYGSDFDWSHFVVVEPRDIPGPNETYLIENDQPVLAPGYVRHMHEAVALVAHEDRNLLRRAVASIQVEIDPDPPVLDFRIAPRPDQIQRGTDNIIKRLQIKKGDVHAAFANAYKIVEGEYETGAQEHVYIENNAMSAWMEEGPNGDVVVVRGSMQCPYYVLNALKHALQRDETRVRVIQAPTGGGFGGKEDYPSTIALHCALLALKARRPVKIIYDRSEDMAATPKRHPSLVRHKTAVAKDGRLLAQHIEVILDGGAYVTLSPVVLSRGIIHAAGPYFCENVLIESKAVLTNCVPYGAFRGFGAPQTIFACERQMDRIAHAVGLEPVEVRRINLLRDGQTTSTQQIVSGGTDRHALLDSAVRASDYDKHKRESEAFNKTHPYLRRGIGVATVLHGAGFTGNGEVYLNSKVDVGGRSDGKIEVLAASTEMGQGTNTAFTAIAAEAAGLNATDIVIGVPDTFRVPNSGPTVASRTVMVVGKLIERAIDDLAVQLGQNGKPLRGSALKAAISDWHKKNPGKELKGRATYAPPPNVKFDDKNYVGDAYATYAWGVCIAHVEVDLRTAAIRVLDFTAMQDIGKVINPVLAKGQVQGGVVQAIGWALSEEFKFKDGGMLNNTLTNYIIPTSDDVPPIRVIFHETPYPFGGGGAKGVGELPMDGPAPAILSAVAHATGADAKAIPLTPEKLLSLLPQNC
ncbi:MAG: xanthine dehydrogenase family protein [Phycisphaeraceae bacterium]|nr:xanthine dehydrogenase family protein [Phycisphaeraceae bacterium]